MAVQPEDTVTQHKGYKLPKGDNYLSGDVERLRETIGKMDTDQHVAAEAIRKERLRRMLNVYPV